MDVGVLQLQLARKLLKKYGLGNLQSCLNLKVFGCIAYAHVIQDKLQTRALTCVFIGYPKEVKGHKLWCLESSQKKIIISHDVVFNEEEFPGLKFDGALHQDDSICQDYNVGV